MYRDRKQIEAAPAIATFWAVVLAVIVGFVVAWWAGLGAFAAIMILDYWFGP